MPGEALWIASIPQQHPAPEPGLCPCAAQGLVLAEHSALVEMEEAEAGWGDTAL